ncbi:hypothetical protein D3C85_1444270 [compost metagenome]
MHLSASSRLLNLSLSGFAFSTTNIRARIPASVPASGSSSLGNTSTVSLGVFASRWVVPYI